MIMLENEGMIRRTSPFYKNDGVIRPRNGTDILSCGIAANYGVEWDESADTYERTGTQAGLVCGMSHGNAVNPIQAAMRRCILNDAGEVVYYLDPNDSTKKVGGAAADLTGADGQVMVEIPMFYYRYSYSGTSHTWEISQAPLEGFSIHPAFVVAGVVKPYIYVGAYEACLYDVSASRYANGIRLEAGNVTFASADSSIERTGESHPFTNLEVGDKIVVSGATDAGNNGTFTVASIVSDQKITVSEAVTDRTDDASVVITSEMDFVNDKLASVSGKTPAVYGTRDNFRVVAVKRGTGWSQQDFDGVSAAQLLYLVEYADFFSQSMIGDGCTDWAGATWGAYNDYNPINKTGLSNSLGNATGNSSLGDGNAGSFMSYRGIENFYGHIWKWFDGFSVNDHVPYVCINPANFADDTTTNYTELGIVLSNANGYQSTLEQQDRGFLPASVGAGSTTKITDYYWQSTGWRVAQLGGAADVGAYDGCFYLSLSNSAADRGRFIGARLQKK